MKTALVLSGGGASGAFQVGALKALHEAGITYDVVAGVSVGSLNGAMVAQGKIERLFEIWDKVEESDVFIRPSLLRVAWNLLWGGRAIYDATPLQEFIEREVCLRDVVTRLYIGFSSLMDGQYHCVRDDDFFSDNGFQKAILASSLMPLLWEPVPEIPLKGVTILDGSDGGIKNVTPIDAVLDELPDRIIAISCNTGQSEACRTTNILQVAKRVVADMMLSEIVKNDLEGALRINGLVMQARDKGFELYSRSGKIYKYFDICVIAPNFKLGSPIDFSRTHIDFLLKTGYDYTRSQNF
jgi:Predicted esterase of the alpha-beta hydrolase superfamily